MICVIELDDFSSRISDLFQYSAFQHCQKAFSV